MKPSLPTPYQDLNALLEGFVTSVEGILGSNFVAAYLQGSFAVGDFDIDSDVDFLVVTADEVTDVQLPALNAMHACLYDIDSIWAKHLEGSYIARELLNRLDIVGLQPLWFLDNMSKSLISSVHDNTWVVRWVVREHGIPLAGPDSKSLFDPIPPAALRDEVMRTMREWGDRLLANRDEMNNRWCQPYVVLSYCRMLQTLETGAIRSKLAAAKWGQQTLAPRWTGLIQRAWAERTDTRLATKVHEVADREDLTSTAEFIGYAIDESKRYGG